VNDFLYLADYNDRTHIQWEHDVLIKALLSALADENVSPKASLNALYHLMLGNWHDSDVEMTTDYRPEVVEITAKLLNSGEEPSAAASAAMALRALLYYAAGGPQEAPKNSIEGRLLRAARLLATDAQSKGIAREIADKTGLSKHSVCDDDDTSEALDLWRQQRAIRQVDQFWTDLYENSTHHTHPAANSLSDPLNPLERIAQALGLPTGELDDDWEDFDEEDEPSNMPSFPQRQPAPQRRDCASNKRIDLSKCFPASEMEFENLIVSIASLGKPEDINTLREKIETSTLSKNAKKRLKKRLEKPFEDDESFPF